jgi:drug/metabolite transporter (DMT)-like permease
MRPRVTRLDALLLLMTLIWGGNYSVIKFALRDLPPIGFNALRLTLASVLFLVAIWARSERSRPLAARDWLGIVGLAVVGQLIYQLLFMSGLSRTSVANSSLIIGTTPVFVALLTAAVGHEQIPPVRWIGAALSAAGIYLVVGRGASVTRASLHGDLLMLGSVLCWTVSTVGARPLLARHSPLVVTGYSMAIGCALYLPFAWVDLRGIGWAQVSAAAWAALAFSAAFGLFVAYIIWYTGVQRLGNTRTSLYSNLVPIAAFVVAAIWLREQIGMNKLAGAAIVLSGLALSRLQDAPVAPPDPV